MSPVQTRLIRPPMTGFVLMTALFAHGLTVNGADANALPEQPGVFDIEFRLEDNKTARFTLELPATSDTGASPLVLVLHYGGTPTRYYGRPLITDLFSPAWEDIKAIYVAPESLGGQWTSETNEAFVMRLVHELRVHYKADSSRTVVAGYSMGAIGSWHLMAHYPQAFSAVVPVAGYPSGPLTCTLPTLSFAAESDEVFAFGPLEKMIEELQRSGAPINLTTVAARGHYDVAGFRQALGSAIPWLKQHWGKP